MKTKRILFLERAALLTAGVYLAGGGLATLSSGRPTHTNYIHAPTSATAAVVIGSLLIALATLGWRWLSTHL